MRGIEFVEVVMKIVFGVLAVCLTVVTGVYIEMNILYIQHRINT